MSCPVRGKAATTAMVLLFAWAYFMVLATVTHRPSSLSEEALGLYTGMFGMWAIAAFLALVYAGVDLVSRASMLRGRRRTLLVVDVFAVILLTMMSMNCLQYSNLYGQAHRERINPWVYSHPVEGVFTYPSTLVPGSEANEAWREFQKWLDWWAPGRAVLGVDFQPDHPVRLLSQCTLELWRTGCEEIRIRIGDGPVHLLRPHYYLDWREDVLLPAEDGGLDSLMMVPEVPLNGFRDQVAPVIDVRELPRQKKIDREELDSLIRESNHRYPMQILVPRDAPLRWLDDLLRLLEDRGARYFDLVYYG